MSEINSVAPSMRDLVEAIKFKPPKPSSWLHSWWLNLRCARRMALSSLGVRTFPSPSVHVRALSSAGPSIGTRQMRSGSPFLVRSSSVAEARRKRDALLCALDGSAPGVQRLGHRRRRLLSAELKKGLSCARVKCVCRRQRMRAQRCSSRTLMFWDSTNGNDTGHDGNK
jgi:hypothetical protein